MVHTIELDLIDRIVRVNDTTTAVVFSSMNVDDERFACHLLCMDACREGKPVVSVNYVESSIVQCLACDDTSHYRVVVDLFEQVLWILARELDTAKVVGVDIAEIGIDLTAKVIIFLRILHDMSTALLDIVPIHILPYHRCLRAADDMAEVLCLVALWIWQDKIDLAFACVMYASHDTECSWC